MQSWDMLENESIQDPLYLFDDFHFSFPPALTNMHKILCHRSQQCPSHPPHPLALTDRALWFLKRHANQPSHREIRFLPLFPVPDRNFTMGFHGIFLINLQKVFCKAVCSITDQNQGWTNNHERCCEQEWMSFSEAAAHLQPSLRARLLSQMISGASSKT